jgi:negative regulator of sigma-B (phosphoserine phosphatase)
VGSRSDLIEVGVATAALHGPSGDRAVVVPRDDGALVCAIDGLGHGEAAAEASAAAAEVLQRDSAPLEELLRRCHRALVRTRGAVMTLVEFRLEPLGMTWVGVGNVEARLLPEMAAPILFGGVVGHNLPTVRPSWLPLRHGDLIVIATDGVRADFAEGLSPAGAAQEIADRVLADAARGDDDALVVVVRWIGSS